MTNEPPRRRLFAPEPPTPLQPPVPSGLSAPGQGASPAVAAPLPPDPGEALHTPGEAYPEVAAWAASLPPGTTGTAAELLPAFLAWGAPSHTRYSAPWTPIALGLSLAKLRDLVANGRYLRRSRTRAGVNVWTVEAVPPR
jgi:hypothetical protein